MPHMATGHRLEVDDDHSPVDIYRNACLHPAGRHDVESSIT